jgi:peptidoglycan/xylan/chitin deacetylase (PgdA/CDA1 family)
MAFGIMFHHFVDQTHPYVQGALTSDDFEAVIRAVGRERIVDPKTWVARTLAGTLRADDVCFTFDDALLSQGDVALPVLDKFDIKAFFFVYSSIFEGHGEHLEIIRYFRNTNFGSPHEFYDEFYEAMKPMPGWPQVERVLASDAAKNYLPAHGFYTREDRIFRYLRDTHLDRDMYYRICENMMAARGFDMRAAAEKIWLDNAWLKRLDAEGHMIGLHSTSHPTNLGTWSRERQAEEYGHNQRHLTAVLGNSPISVSYPNGSYNSATLSIMHEMGVKVGFRSDDGKANGSQLEQPRLDHVLYMQRFAT